MVIFKVQKGVEHDTSLMADLKVKQIDGAAEEKSASSVYHSDNDFDSTTISAGKCNSPKYILLTECM